MPQSVGSRALRGGGERRCSRQQRMRGVLGGRGGAQSPQSREKRNHRLQDEGPAVVADPVPDLLSERNCTLQLCPLSGGLLLSCTPRRPSFEKKREVKRWLERVQVQVHVMLEGTTKDMDLIGRLLDELDLLQRRSQDAILDMVEVKVQKLIPELWFMPDIADRLVAFFW